jgi:hypothetical protein
MKYPILFLASLFLISTGCDENNVLNSDKQTSRLEMNISGLQAPGDSAWYEAWIVWLDRDERGDTEQSESIGLLEIDQNGDLVTKSFDIDMGYLQAGLTIVVSIEEDDIPGMAITELSENDSSWIDTTLGPSSYKILAANIIANAGEFSIGNARVLDLDMDWSFENSEATLFLDTPTDGENTNPLNGIWFAKQDSVFEDTLVSVEIAQGLDLPQLPAGWKYEAFVKLGDSTYSFGQFARPTGPDGSSVYSGNQKGHSFPGEDFLFDKQGNEWLPDLSGAEIYIMLKAAHPEVSEYPFSQDMIPFSFTIPENPEPRKNYKMDNMSAMLPGGTIQISIEIYE